MSLSIRAKIGAALVAASSIAALTVGATSAQAITGGTAVTTADYSKSRFVVFISTGGKTGKGAPIRCTGVLVAPDRVLTSFACLRQGTGATEDATQVIGGRADINGTGGTVSGVVGYTYAKDFTTTDDGVPVWDVAILKLAKKMPYTPVKIVPQSYKYTANTKARILGWGMTGNTEEVTYQNHLRQANIAVLPNSSCEAAYTKKNFQSDKMVCAGNPNGGVDFCFGDEGAPLLVTQGKEEYVAGVASWGNPDCGVAKYPGVYASTTPYDLNSWLRQ